jgi:hypothetical protein
MMRVGPGARLHIAIGPPEYEYEITEQSVPFWWVENAVALQQDAH